MASMSLADAKARLSEVVDRVEAGESIEITRRGRLAAIIVPPETKAKKQPIDVEELRRFRETMPYQEISATDLIRQMRDEGY